MCNEKTPVLNVVNLGQLKLTNKCNLFINNSSRDTSAANHQQNNAKLYTAVEVDNTKSLRQTKLSQENKKWSKGKSETYSELDTKVECNVWDESAQTMERKRLHGK